MRWIRIQVLASVLALGSLSGGCSALTDFSPDNRGGDGGANNQNNSNTNGNTNTNTNTNNANAPTFVIDSDSGDVEDGLAVASAPGGRILVVWAARVGTSNNTLTFYGRLYKSDGTADSERFTLWSSPIALLDNLTVTWASDDRVLVAWSGTAIGDTNHTEARIFDGSGTPRSAALRLNEEGITSAVASTASADGQFFVLWNGYHTEGDELRGRFVDADTSEPDTELSITSLPESSRGVVPAIVTMEDGTYYVAWADGSGGDDLNIVAKQLDAAGADSSAVFDVHADDPGDQRAPTIGRLGSGRFLVVWVNEAVGGESAGIQGRVFDGPDSPLYAVREVTETISGMADPWNRGVGLSTTDSGRSLVAWQHQKLDGDSTLYIRGYSSPDSGGAPVPTLDGPSADEPPTCPRVTSIGDAELGYFVVWRRPLGGLAGDQRLYGTLLDPSFNVLPAP